MRARRVATKARCLGGATGSNSKDSGIEPLGVLLVAHVGGCLRGAISLLSVRKIACHLAYPRTGRRVADVVPVGERMAVLRCAARLLPFVCEQELEGLAIDGDPCGRHRGSPVGCPVKVDTVDSKS